MYKLMFPLWKVVSSIFNLNVSGAVCVIENNGELLLIRNTYGEGKWIFPGGGLKSGETPKEAARREVQEEVGIELSELKDAGSFLNKRSGFRNTIYVFTANTDRRDIEIDPGEILEARWFPAGNLPIGDISEVGLEMLRLAKA